MALRATRKQMKIGLGHYRVLLGWTRREVVVQWCGKPAEKPGPDIDSNPKLLLSVMIEKRA